MSDWSGAYSSMAVINLDRVCRLCVCEGAEMKPLFIAEREEVPLNEILTCSTQLEVTENDGLPCQICLDCDWKLHSLYKFKKQCETTDAILRKYISKAEAKIFRKEGGGGIIKDVKAEDGHHMINISNGDLLDFMNISSIKLEEKKHNRHNTLLNNQDNIRKTSLREQSTQTDLQNSKAAEETDCKSITHNRLDIIWDRKTDSNINGSTEFKTYHDTDNDTKAILDGSSEGTRHKIKIEVDLQSEYKITTNQVDVSIADLLDSDTVDLLCSDIQPNADFKSNVINVKNEPLDELLDDAERENGLLDGDVVGSLADVLLGVDNGSLHNPPDASDSSNSDYVLDALRRKRKRISLCKKKNKIGPTFIEPSSSGNYSCDICLKSCTTARGLKLHTTRSHADRHKKYTCDICGKKLSRMTHLNRHMVLHETPGKYMCDQCPKSFNRKYNLSRHVWQHVDEKPHACNKCSKAFAHIQQLENHILYMHTENSRITKTATCPICQREFSEKYMDTHMRMHTGDKTFTCTVCNKTFNSKWHLKEHNKWHSTEKPFLCSECGQRFIRNDYLVIHMRRHKGEKPYKCTYCSKGFPRATDLTVHERYHTGEKTHLCTVCGKGFQRQYNLKVHLRVHTGEKPYICSHCGKKFAQGNDLKSHVRRHTGERYNCEVCGQGFIQGYHLTQHKRSMHGIECGSHIKRVEKYPMTTSPKSKKLVQRRPRTKPHPLPELLPLQKIIDEKLKSSKSDEDVIEVEVQL